MGYYINQHGRSVFYVDPLADDREDVFDNFAKPAVILMAHNRNITYGYTGLNQKDTDYFEFQPGSVIVDPWRVMTETAGYKVIHYGNTRSR